MTLGRLLSSGHAAPANDDERSPEPGGVDDEDGKYQVVFVGFGIELATYRP